MIKLTKPIITDKDVEDVSEVLRSGMIVQGPKVKELEERFAEYCGSKYAVAFNSGTAALHAALYSLGIGEGDEVITTPFTFVATANSVLMQNAKIVFADINEENFCLDPGLVEGVISDKTKAILPVSLFGLPYPEEINSLAKKHDLYVVDDAAQAIGSNFDGKKTGERADITSFSLYATKNIMSAEGGMITTNNDRWAEFCRRFRHHGQSAETRYEYYDLGYNYRMTDIHAAIGLNQLDKLEEYTLRRIENANRLSSGLEEIDGLLLPKVPSNLRHVFHQYTIRVTSGFPMNRDELCEYLSEKGIGSGVYYSKPLHLHPHFRDLGFEEGQFPVAERVAKEVLSLPVHPSVEDSDVDFIIEAFKSI